MSWPTPDGRVQMQLADRWSFHASDGHQLSDDLTRATRDRLYAAHVNQGYDTPLPASRVTVADVSVLKEGGYDLPMAHLIAVFRGQTQRVDIPNGQLGLDGQIKDGIFAGQSLRQVSEALEANPNYRPPYFLGSLGDLDWMDTFEKEGQERGERDQDTGRGV
jgi:hypothetical protein